MKKNHDNFWQEQIPYLTELTPEDQLKFAFNARFSQCITSQRKKLGLTQEALADKSGVNRVTIAKLERYQRMASTDVILKLLDALGLDIQFVERSELQKWKDTGNKGGIRHDSQM